MKAVSALVFAVSMIAGFSVPAVAQQPMPSSPAMPGMRGHAPGGMHMCGGGSEGMMCPMMKGGRSAAVPGGAMPTMGGECGAEPATGMPAAGSPQESPRMVQLRGEMLKAMGEVMAKYGKLMEEAAR